MVRRIVRLRWRHRLGPVQIAGRLGMPASTVHAVLVRCRINRLSRIDRVTGEPLRRYEHDHPGSLIHVDVTKFGNIPDGGGWRYVGKQQGDKNKATTALRTGRTAKAIRNIGTAFLHTVIDDHSRVAYAEICADEKAATAIGVLRRAVAWFADHGVTVERVLSDNGSAYRSHAWRDACAELGITPKRTRPYRPQTNGKIERFHRTLADGWAYARFYDSEAATPSRPARLAPLLQSPPSPLRHRRPATGHPTDQPPWTSHLGRPGERIEARHERPLRCDAPMLRQAVAAPFSRRR